MPRSDGPQDGKTRVTPFNAGLIWFGAALSIAEMLTGTFIAPLGIGRGLAAVIVGHVIGGVLLFLAALIGARTHRGSMDTVKIAFGTKGSSLFSVCNIVQLIGWTAIMIAQGASASAALFDVASPGSLRWIWCLVIGALIAVWIACGIVRIPGLSAVICAALLVLTMVLTAHLGGVSAAPSSAAQTIAFGDAVELCVAMSLSWLPLIADYTRDCDKPVATSITSAGVYAVVSSWMFAIGLIASVSTGAADIPGIMLGSGMGVAGLVIVILSTVTTTFLDANSAGLSARSLIGGLDARVFALVVCAVGVVLSIFTPIEAVTDFLYLIGSVFAPMAAILFVDYFVLHRDLDGKTFDVANLCIWFAGFIIYRLAGTVSTPLGYTLPAMVATAVICLVVRALMRRRTVRLHADATHMSTERKG